MTRLPIDVRSVAVARTILHDMLDGSDRTDGSVSDPGARADAALMVSELVTNAIRHTHDLLLLEVRVAGGLLHVTVTDDSAASPVLHDSDHQMVHGRGMRIVDSLADRWGTSRSGKGKSVWFELTLP